MNLENKPNYTYLTVPGRGNTDPKSANVYATDKGWVFRHPWGEEVLVAIGMLGTTLGTAVVNFLFAENNGQAHNAAAQTLRLLVEYDKGVAVTGSPTVTATQTGANVASVTLTYDPTTSDPASGKLYFQNTNVNLATGTVGGTFTVNSSSVVAGFAGITDAETTAAVANGVTAGLSAVFTITT